MHGIVICVVGLLALGSILGPVSGRMVTLDHDRIYAPDQVDYIRAWATICQSEDSIYWPQHRRCYAENNQGPCADNEVLLLDRLRFVPYCAPESKGNTLVEETAVPSHGEEMN